MKYEGDSDTNFNSGDRNNSQRLGKVTGRLRNQMKNRDHPNYSIIKISQNTEKSP